MDMWQNALDLESAWMRVYLVGLSAYVLHKNMKLINIHSLPIQLIIQEVIINLLSNKQMNIIL